jgi:solute carrier family 25 uncoupling protein 8/9
MLTGLVTTTVTNPVDMIKTQMMMDKGGGGKGVLATVRLVVERHGAMGIMRGWSANYVRLGPQTVITFIALEKFRATAGMAAL